MTALQTYDTLIDVPFYSQLDRDNGLDDFWRERGCGILALKMVLDFWGAKTGQPPIPAAELLDKVNVVGSRKPEAGWVHATIVAAARQYGYLAWRRGWMLSSDGRQRFTAEGAGPTTLELIDAQQHREAYPTLVEAIEQGYPVIVSVARNFDEVHKPHIIVLSGIRRTKESGDYRGFFYNDPYSPTHQDRKDSYVSLAQFSDKWRAQAIFVLPPDVLK